MLRNLNKETKVHYHKEPMTQKSNYATWAVTARAFDPSTLVNVNVLF